MLTGPFVRSIHCLTLEALSWAAVLSARADDTVTVSTLSFVNKGLVGVGRMPADLRDQFGETVGSGSGLAVDPGSWIRTPRGYQGVFDMLPDRGYNVAGTTDFRARLYKLVIVFNPPADPVALPADARQKTVSATLTDSILLKEAAEQSLTGLDPAEGGVRPAADGFPAMPQASTGAISLDSEGVVRMPDGSFFISDEYGPYIYRFSADGRLLSAIRPPEALVPKRNGKDHFASNNSGAGAPKPMPENPDTGRQNNQGFEGLALTPGGKFLVVALQSATRQDSGN
jgi:hypothetical protein